MRGLRWTVVIATVLAGVLTACSDGPGDSASRRTVTSSGSTTTAVTPTTSAARAGTVAEEACDREEARTAVLVSGGAGGGGSIDYLECLDGFGWALYSLGGDSDAAHVLLSIGTDGYDVLNLGTSVCAAESGMPADVAAAIAPWPAAANDCPEPGPTGGETGGGVDPTPDDEGHQPWREACAEDPTAYAGCQP
jgi:hypothetical protein